MRTMRTSPRLPRCGLPAPSLRESVVREVKRAGRRKRRRPRVRQSFREINLKKGILLPMAARGPLPSAHSLPTARGTNTFFATAPAEPPEVDVSPPAWLAGEALSVWAEKAPPLVAAGRLRSSARETFATFCQLAADCQRLSKEVDNEGDVITSARGSKPNPKCRLLRDARRDLLAYSKAFGMDAASAARLPASPAASQPANPLLTFAARRGA
jgi:P27 family predicted phage terminase small subunit